MSTSYSYDTLVEALQEWSSDFFDDYLDQLPDIIAKAETRLLRDLGLELFNQTDTSKSTAAATETLALPDGAIQLHSLFLDGNPVLPREESYVRHYQTIATSDLPRYWCQQAETSVILAPIPDAVYAARMRVMIRPAGLSDANPTTWLSTHAGDLLFWQAMSQTESWNKAPDDLAIAETRYMALLPAAKEELMLLAHKVYP